MSAAKKSSASSISGETHFSKSGGSPPQIQTSQPAVASPAVVHPLLIDIRAAAQLLGTSVFNLRVCMWNAKTRAMLSPVRLGAKYLFSPTKLTAFAEALVAGRIEFPATPSKATPKRKVAR